MRFKPVRFSKQYDPGSGLTVRLHTVRDEPPPGKVKDEPMSLLHELHIRDEISTKSARVDGAHLSHEPVESRHQRCLAARLQTSLERVHDKVYIVEFPRCFSA
jgi:hypothetical protein